MHRHFISISVFVLCVASSAFAAPNAILRGHVTDAGNHILPGATVRVAPIGATATTDRDGNFVFADLPNGTYTVEVEYVGFLPESRQVTLSGSPVALDVKLNLSPTVSESVTVTASRERGQVEALNERKTAPNIVDVLPQETIASLPNANVAEALARLPSVSVERDEGEPKYVQVRGLEPRFTSVTVNGVRIPSDQPDARQIKLDSFPSDMVQMIELNKTVSADQEGDAIGGAINLVTPTAGDTSQTTAMLEGGYTSIQGGRPRSRFDTTYSNRFGQDKALGLIVGATYDYNGRAINDIEPAPGVVSLPNGNTASAFTGADYRDYRYQRRRFGAIEGLDYRVSDATNLYVRGLFSEFHNYGDRWVRSVSAGNFLTPNLTDDSGGFSANVQHRTPNEQTFSVATGGNQLFQNALLDYDVSYSHARQDSANYTTADFNGPSAAFAVDSSNGNIPKLTPIGVTGLDPSQYSLADIQFSSGNTWTPSLGVGANVLLPHQQWDLKAGARFRSDTKHNTAFSRFFNADGSLPMTQVMSSFTDPNYYFGWFPQGPNPNLFSILDYFNKTPGAFSEDINKEHLRNDPNNFTAREKVAAAYAKTTERFGNNFVLDTGVRLEHTTASYDAFIVTTGNDRKWASTTPTNASHSYSNLLPSVSLRYALDRETNLRLAYGWTLGRPNFSDLVPSFRVLDYRNQVSVGNPNLKPTHAQNYDLMLEHFFSSVGVVSAGVFYKDLKNPIYPGATSRIIGGTFDGFTQIQPINGPRATIQGFEVAWQQQFGFLPGLFSGFGIDANYTHTSSKATFDTATGRTGTAALQRTAPNTGNMGITYDKGRVTFRAAASYNSASIFFYNYSDGADGGLRGPNGDTYLYPHTQVDAQLSYALPAGVQIFVNGLNLNNEVFGFYNGSPQWNIQREFYSRTYSAGLKLVR